MAGDLQEHFPFVAKIFSEVDSVSQRLTGISIMPVLASAVRKESKDASEVKSLLLQNYFVIWV